MNKIGAVIFVLLSFAMTASAASVSELRSSIESHNSQIEALNKEIALYEKQLTEVSGKKKTLQNTIGIIDTTRKKIVANINATKAKIGATQDEIENLQIDIGNKQALINHDRSSLAETVRVMRMSDDASLVSQILTPVTLSTFWHDASQQADVQDSIRTRVDHLGQEKASLDAAKQQHEGKRDQLVSQKTTLVTEQGSLEATRKTQAEILAATKNQESTFQKLIAEKRRQEQQFEDALLDLKSKLNYAVNLDQVNSVGSGVLSWPVDNVRITQNFGDTDFSRGGAYHGKGHNGIDLAASIGTPLKAALQGVVLATGNTDAIRGCYSFGKWVMVSHDNGLNTMYAHLSSISVSQGQSVQTGEVIGYSGSTGYATGPHLHFGVYVGSATKIIKLGEATNSTTKCSNAVMPVVPVAGYLDPMRYL